jgi:gamma-glutamyltranspeptidase/glutathione hydrolase
VAPERAVSEHHGPGGVAVTPDELATTAATDVLRAGGNAVDAAIAANATLGMVYPTTCGIGGDLLAIVHAPGMDRPAVLNASGRGGSGLDAAALRAAGHTTVPLREPSSVTVPGCVDGWVALLGRFGTRTLADLLGPVIALGTDGFRVGVEFADDLARIRKLIAGQPSADAMYPGGEPPAAGATLTRPDLARTLSAIAASGRSAFYEGPVAAAISAATRGVLTPEDLAANASDWVEPIGATVFGLTGWTVPPNSQGYLTLAALMLVEALDPPRDPDDPALHHTVIEAYRAVAWERDDLVADPGRAPLTPDALLDPERILNRVSHIDPRRVASWPDPRPAPGGTAYLCVVDADDMAVSLIQSNFSGIGSGIGAGDTGVFLHNRGAGFNLEPGHPNEAAPGRRPLHTLSPTLWTDHGRAAMTLGTRGGHQQPQYLSQAAAALLHLGLDPAATQALPRWHADQAGDVAGSSLLVEARMPDAVVDGLEARGHRVERGPDRPQGWGPVSMIVLDPDGGRRAAADPRVTTATAQGA